MLRNALTVAFRTLRSHPIHATINVVGLALGLAVCLLIARYVEHEYRYDDFHAAADRIFRVLVVNQREGEPEQRFAQTPVPLAAQMIASLPNIEHAVRLDQEDGVVRRNGELFETTVSLADSGFFDVFDLPLAQGNAATALDAPTAVVLSADAAQRFFGSSNPMGKTVSIRLGTQFYDATVTGITEPPPSNSSLRFDVLLPLARASDFNRVYASANEQRQWGTLRPSLYVQLVPGTSRASLAASLPAFVDQHVPPDYIREVRLQPLSEVHFDPSITGGWASTTDPQYLYILMSIAAFVLLIACINFMILSVSRSTERAHEVGVRKTAGGTQLQLMAQFWGEAFLLCTLALGIGLGGAALARPVFGTLVDASLPPTQWTDVALAAGLLLVAGLVASSYPAVHLSRFQPVDVLRGHGGTDRMPRLVRGLIVVQFALSIALIIGTVGMARQMDVLQRKSLGFETEQVVRLSVPFRNGTTYWQRLRAALADDPRVQHVAGSWNQLGGGDGVSFNPMPVATGRPMKPGDRAAQRMSFAFRVLSSEFGVAHFQSLAARHHDGPEVLVTHDQ